MGRKKKGAGVPTPVAENDEELRKRIAKKSYERYLDRGQLDGYDLEDWLEAEMLVLGELGEEAGEKY